METQNQVQDIQANYDKNIDVKPFKFHFKKDKLGNKRESIELNLPIPSVEGVIAILQAGGKQLDLLLAAVADIPAAQARSILNDNEEMQASNFPYEQCTWQFIAEMPEAEKRDRGIPKEVWEEFAADYIGVMPGVTGKSLEAVTLAAKLFVNKFNSVKTDKPVLKKLKEQLGIYTNSAPNAETYVDCIKFLDEKCETLLQAEGTALLNNL